MKKKPKKRAGRPKKHKKIKVSQRDDFNAYHRAYRRLRKKDPLPMGKLFSKKERRDPFPL